MYKPALHEALTLTHEQQAQESSNAMAEAWQAWVAIKQSPAKAFAKGEGDRFTRAMNALRDRCIQLDMFYAGYALGKTD